MSDRKMMIKVKNGQDPYSVIGQYIRDHVSAIEDMIAVIEIDGKISNELFMVDMTVDGYFIWKSDWYEGGENVALIDFFPVSDACNPKDYWIPCSERLPKENVYVLVWCGEVKIARIIHGISKEQRAKMQDGAIDDPVSYGWNLSNGYFKVKRSESYRTCDENGNNKVPYCWDCIYGEMFGQDVKAWMPLPEPYKGEQE